MRDSVVYVIGSADIAPVKIGVTISPQSRLKQLQPGAMARLEVLWTTPGDTTLERTLHARFDEYRVYGEWFDLTSIGDPVAVVQDAVRDVQQASTRAVRADCPDPEGCWTGPCIHVGDPITINRRSVGEAVYRPGRPLSIS